MLPHIGKLAVHLIYSGVKAEMRHHIVKHSFQGLSATIDILVGTYRLIGRIFTMTESRRAILFSSTWLKADEDQARFRISRIGQTNEMLGVRFVADGTVGTLVVRKQDKKTKFDERVLGLPDENRNWMTEEELLHQLNRPKASNEEEEVGIKIVGGYNKDDPIDLGKEE